MFSFQVEVHPDTLEVTTKGDIHLFPEENQIERASHIQELQKALLASKNIVESPSGKNSSQLLVNLTKSSEDLLVINAKNARDLQRNSQLQHLNKVSYSAKKSKEQSVKMLLKEAQDLKSQKMTSFPVCELFTSRLVLK